MLVVGRPLASRLAAVSVSIRAPAHALVATRGFRGLGLRRYKRPTPLPVTLKFVGAPTARDLDSGAPLPAPRVGGYEQPQAWQPQGGAIPRTHSLKMPGEGGVHSPFEDPGAPPAGTPMEPDKQSPPWKVLRTHNGNLPVYLKVKFGGAEAFTQVRHVFGDIEHMRKALAMVCEAPVRVRSGVFEVRGLHEWKIKEWLTALGM
mmetsp:Transcript_56132/g.119513  ORF Transcript_56132/g.119513 Transcript_56132/m.119513 type:complete len:203 (-) Transcript_56132:43-651(-)